MAQQGDVLLYQANDGGDITVEAGLVAMSGGLETAAYLSLFGGNEQDDGRKSNVLQWWGNVGEAPERQYRSETQYLLRSIPSIPANLRRLEEAATRDLSWFISTKVATSLDVQASMPGLNKVRLIVSIETDGAAAVVEFIENWKADA